ncbi:hypothetical protein [Bradyrhizobium sp. LVM 105]|uniref:hypothetical protein n=1 Tax=Bradyrhizobium sp. LVM 105 TaxID=2341115 RepID=UPI001FE04687|nr:hypothetical protein [Bradyrhizobium sp. LVM 105]
MRVLGIVVAVANKDCERRNRALKAILAACEDAGIDPREIDGFASYGDDRSEASHLAAALGIRQLRAATMQWGAAISAANLRTCWVLRSDQAIVSGWYRRSDSARS